jgi:glycosyltransferase involved in cell wall biosynthesis
MAHVYLTYPFVLGWSMIEAMAAGCTVIGSRTPPVLEVLREGENGLLVDFAEPEALGERIAHVFEAPQAFAHLGAQARRDVVARYDLRSVCLPQQLRLVQALAEGREPDVGAPGA